MSRLLLVTSAVLACLLGAWQSAFGGSPNPFMWISKVTIDTVSLTTPSRVTIEVAGGSRGGLTDVSAWIDTGQGYTISSQPAVRTDTLRRGNTCSLVGVIQATVKGTWYVQVVAKGILRDGTTATGKDGLYILLSDTLNRAMTGFEYYQLPQGRVMEQKSAKSDSVIYRPGLKISKPAVRDSLYKHRTGRGKRSGSFDVIGSLLYHDARDPQDWWTPAINMTVEVWNDNEYDNPSSSDELLGTTVTDSCGRLRRFVHECMLQFVSAIPKENTLVKSGGKES